MKKQIVNPYLPFHVCEPDGEPHVFGDRVYVYGSHDEEGGNRFCKLNYEFYSAPVDDLTSWSSRGISYDKTNDPDYSEPGRFPDMYAPDVVIRRKTFDDAKVLKHWLVLVDGTELDSGYKQKNEHYLERCYNRGTEHEKTKYHRAVLEAKLYLGNGLMVSIGTETIENDDDYIKYKYSEEERKQDCEIKAFKRLVKKIKQAFPRLPICIVADGLYVAENIMDLCESYHWKFIIRYKEGCAKSIEEEYIAVPEKERAGSVNYVNEMVYRARTINVLEQKETKIKSGKEITTEFKWITNFEVKKGNAQKLARAGRLRWKIENQGFNRQKRWQGHLEHACSWNAQAQKNHYLMQQIADFMRQLYEYFYLKKNEIKKAQKNIPSDILKSFAELEKSEDIFPELDKTVLN